MDRKKIYNPESIETRNSRRNLGENRQGIFEFIDIKYSLGLLLYWEGIG